MVASTRRPGPSRASVAPFDVVYTWADRTDPQWRATRRAEFERFVAGLLEGAALPIAPDDEPGGALGGFRYSLRSVHRHLRGMRKLFVVAEQAPDWLVGDHPAVEIVPHLAVFDDPPFQLPSYNSQAIEAGLHRIPGLGERFVYFNDYFYLLQRHDAGDFFTVDVRIRVRLGRGLAARGAVVPGEPVDASAQKNTNRVLDAAFGRRFRLTVMHRPRALTK